MTRSTMACAVAAGAALGLACGAQDTQASAAAGIASPQGGTVRVLGTISATVDGTARTWHVVAGPSAGRPYASGLWTVAPSGRRTIVVAGFDTPTPPLDTFTWNAAGMPTSYGEYTGSTIGLTLRVGAEATPFRLVYPPEDIPALVYAARASLTAVDGLNRGDRRHVGLHRWRHGERLRRLRRDADAADRRRRGSHRRDERHLHRDRTARRTRAPISRWSHRPHVGSRQLFPLESSDTDVLRGQGPAGRVRSDRRHR